MTSSRREYVVAFWKKSCSPSGTTSLRSAIAGGLLSCLSFDELLELLLSDSAVDGTSFVARDESRNWSDVYVVSDYDRNDCIWRVPVSEIRRLFNVTAQDYPHSVHLVYNHEKGDYDVSTN